MGVGARIWKPTLDCADLHVSARFWGWLLDSDVSGDDGKFRVLSGKDGVPVLCLQHVDEPRQGKNRMHLDLTVTDLDTAVEEIARQGGGQVDGPHEVPGGRWFVMADPEGNEFCVVEFAT